MKDEFLANLLKSGNMSTPHNKLVSVVVDKESDSGESIGISKSTSAQVEGPTMMEMMMAAHLDAKNEKVLSEDIEAKKTTKHFGTGFKKGFFTGTTEKKSHNVDNGTVAIPMNEKEAYLSWMQNKGEANTFTSSITPSSVKEQTNISLLKDKKEKTVDIPTIRRKNAGSRNISHASREKVCLGSDSGPTASINADVQKAMIEDEAPILKELKQGGTNVRCLAVSYMHSDQSRIFCSVKCLE